MYLESFGNPRRFTEIAKRVRKKKPILIVKSGRTGRGARRRRHTGALAGADVTVSAFLEQCGVLRADTIEELSTSPAPSTAARCRTATGSRSSPTPAGRRSWPPTPASTSVCAMAELPETTAPPLAAFLPAAASVKPGRHDRFGDRCAVRKPSPRCSPTRRRLRDRDQRDAAARRPRRRARRLARAAAAGARKPVLAVMMAPRRSTLQTRSARPAAGLPFPGVGRARLPSSAATPPGGGRRSTQPLPRLDRRRRGRGPARSPARRGYLDPATPFSVLERLRRPDGAVAAGARRGESRRRGRDRLSGRGQGDRRGGWCTRATGAVRPSTCADGGAGGAVDRHRGAPRAGARRRGFLVQRMARDGHEVDLRHLHRSALRTAPHVRSRRQVRRGLRDVRFGVTPLIAASRPGRWCAASAAASS